MTIITLVNFNVFLGNQNVAKVSKFPRGRTSSSCPVVRYVKESKAATIEEDRKVNIAHQEVKIVFPAGTKKALVDNHIAQIKAIKTL